VDITSCKGFSCVIPFTCREDAAAAAEKLRREALHSMADSMEEVQISDTEEAKHEVSELTEQFTIKCGDALREPEFGAVVVLLSCLTEGVVFCFLSVCLILPSRASHMSAFTRVGWYAIKCCLGYCLLIKLSVGVRRWLMMLMIPVFVVVVVVVALLFKLLLFKLLLLKLFKLLLFKLLLFKLLLFKLLLLLLFKLLLLLLLLVLLLLMFMMLLLPQPTA
jgi:hypothetical protein